MIRHVAAIDLGTQSLRLSVAGPSGHIEWSWSRPVGARIEGDIYEQDPNEWRALLFDGLEAMAAAGLCPAAIAACGPLAGFVELDHDGRPLGPATTYADRRPAAFVATVQEAVAMDPAEDPYALRCYGADPLPQLLFARQKRRNGARFLDATGYLNFLLSGVATLNEYSALRLYGPSVLSRLGVPESSFGTPVRTGAKIGRLDQAIARRLNWPDVVVVSAPFDSKCAYLASGLRQPGDMADISGTVTSLGVLVGSHRTDPARRIYSVPVGDNWLVRGSTAMAGGILEWAKRELYFSDFDAFDAAVASTAPGADGVTFLPYLAGERAPLWLPHATGAFLGLRLDSNRAHLARSVYEGLAFAVRHIVDVMIEVGADPRSVVASGGLSRNRLLLQIKADTLGLSYEPTENPELTTSGLAAIAAFAIGIFPSIDAAAASFVRRQPPTVPDPNKKAIYDRRYRDYRVLVDSLSPGYVNSHS